jgi:hypothetical protein
VPEKLEEMIASNRYRIFRDAACGQNFQVMEWLEKRATQQQLQEMIELHFHPAFAKAVESGHLKIMKWLAKQIKNEEQLEGMIEDAIYFSLNDAIDVDVINWLLAFPKIFVHAASLAQHKRYVNDFINTKLQALRNRQVANPPLSVVRTQQEATLCSAILEELERRTILTPATANPEDLENKAFLASIIPDPTTVKTLPNGPTGETLADPELKAAAMEEDVNDFINTKLQTLRNRQLANPLLSVVPTQQEATLCSAIRDHLNGRLIQTPEDLKNIKFLASIIPEPTTVKTLPNDPTGDILAKLELKKPSASFLLKVIGYLTVAAGLIALACLFLPAVGFFPALSLTAAYAFAAINLASAGGITFFAYHDLKENKERQHAAAPSPLG